MLIVSALIAGVFLYLALRGLDWRNFFVTLKNARYGYLPIALLWSTASFFMRALRLRVLLSSETPVPITNVFRANMAGYLETVFCPRGLVN
ncbi:MAG: flippase-like domain-containing protein [Anaerolineales bacterium]|nr:flippase-like domain-containing protein [Anaerolineales bacterium]